MKFNLIIFFSMTCCFLSAQISDSLFSASDLMLYTNIKSMPLSTGLNSDSMLNVILTGSGISVKRFSQILINGIEGKKESISKEEEKVMDAISKLNVLIAEYKENILYQNCKNNNFPLEKYKSIDKIFCSDISFQQKLLPFFKQQNLRE